MCCFGRVIEREFCSVLLELLCQTNDAVDEPTRLLIRREKKKRGNILPTIYSLHLQGGFSTSLSLSLSLSLANIIIPNLSSSDNDCQFSGLTCMIIENKIYKATKNKRQTCKQARRERAEKEFVNENAKRTDKQTNKTPDKTKQICVRQFS